MKQRTPLRAKRDKPRRSEGRVQHKRLKQRVASPPSAAERFHLDRVAIGPCVSCGTTQSIVLHHIMKCAGKAKRRDHRFVARLCATCHNMGNGSVHLLGSEAAFLKATGIDLAAWAVEQWEISCAIREGRVAGGAGI